HRRRVLSRNHSCCFWTTLGSLFKIPNPKLQIPNPKHWGSLRLCVWIWGLGFGVWDFTLKRSEGLQFHGALPGGGATGADNSDDNRQMQRANDHQLRGGRPRPHRECRDDVDESRAGEDQREEWIDAAARQRRTDGHRDGLPLRP